MDPGATVNCDVNVWARCWPSELTAPPAPPGTVIVSVAPGTSGPVAWNCSSDGDSTAQEPGDRRAEGRHRTAGGEVGGELHRDGRPGGDVGPGRGDGGHGEGDRWGGGGGRGLVGAPVLDDDEAAAGDHEHGQAHGEDHPQAWAPPTPDVVSRHGSGDSTGV